MTDNYQDNFPSFIGVSFNKKTNKWRARATHDGYDRHLGCFDTYLEAVMTRVIYNCKHGLTHNDYDHRYRGNNTHRRPTTITPPL